MKYGQAMITSTFVLLLLAGVAGAQQSAPKKKHKQGPINTEERGGTRGDASKGSLWLVVNVRDANGKPIPSAAVEVSGPDNEKKSGATDDRGRVSFGNLVSGRYAVVIAKPGFTSESSSYELKDDVPALATTVVLKPEQQQK